MNTYKEFYKGRTTEVMAETSYKAQLKAAAYFKTKQSYLVTVVLCAVGDREVIHTPTF